MRLLSSSAIAGWFGFTCSCPPAPRAWQWDEEGVQGLCAWPGLPSPAPGMEESSQLLTGKEMRWKVLYCRDRGGGLEHHHSGLEHHGILMELGLNLFCLISQHRFSHLRTENSWVYLFAREGIQWPTCFHPKEEARSFCLPVPPYQKHWSMTVDVHHGYRLCVVAAA